MGEFLTRRLNAFLLFMVEGSWTIHCSCISLLTSFCHTFGFGDLSDESDVVSGTGSWVSGLQYAFVHFVSTYAVATSPTQSYITALGEYFP